MEKSPKSSRLLNLFLEEIDILISKGEWNSAIKEIAIFVGAITKDPKTVRILFSSSELDQACKKIAIAYQSMLKKEILLRMLAFCHIQYSFKVKIIKNPLFWSGTKNQGS